MNKYINGQVDNENTEKVDNDRKRNRVEKIKCQESKGKIDR